jgi:hypothetical protein
MPHAADIPRYSDFAACGMMSLKDLKEHLYTK